MSARGLWIAGALATLGACSPGGDGSDDAGGGSSRSSDAEAPGLFRDATAASGIDLVLTAGKGDPRQIVEVKGGGLGVIDYDNDGDLDVFAPNGATLDAPDEGAGARLYRNDGALAFADATRDAAVAWDGWGMGVAAGDVDGNGFQDLFIAAFREDALLVNDGGRFRDATGASGLGDDGWGTGSAFGDLDLDGDLDLYLVRYLELDLDAPPPPTRFLGVEVFDGPAGLTALADRVYANDGTGAFADVTDAWGFGGVKPSYGLGCLVLDLDEDGFQDVYVGNDSMANFLFAGGVGGAADRFEDVALRAGVAVNADGDTQATMGIAHGDVDGDGRADLFSTNFMTDTNTLFVSTDRPRFYRDRTQPLGLAMISRPYLGWAAMFGDVDLDGDEDLLSFNGHVYPDRAVEALGTTSRQEPLCFLRDGARFRRLTADVGGAWLRERHNDRSAVLCDLDADGDLDLVLAERAGPIRLLEGRAADAGGTGVVVRLRDARGGAMRSRGLGAKVQLVGPGGEVRATRWIAGGGSYLAACAPEVHFGGADLVRGATVRVRWPDGHVQEEPLVIAPVFEVVRK